MGGGLFDSWRGAASATCAACALGARGCALRAPLRPQGGGAHAKQGTRLQAGVREACAQGARVVLARQAAGGAVAGVCVYVRPLVRRRGARSRDGL